MLNPTSTREGEAPAHDALAPVSTPVIQPERRAAETAASPLGLGDIRLLVGRTVLQIIPELDAGGAERTAIDVAGGLVAAGARALVATEGGRLVGELQAKGGVWVPFPAKTKNPLAMLLNVRRLARIAHHERASLIHARSRAPAWVALGAARALGIPFVTTYHGSYGSRSPAKRLYNSVMTRGDAVIANSGYTADLIREVYPDAEARLRVVYRGTDLAAFTPGAVAPERVDALRRKWGLDPHQRIVLLAARLTSWKGQLVLVEAAARLQREGVGDVAYVLAGDPQGRDGYVREIDRLIADRKLTGIVRRVGHCDDMPAALLAATVLVVPSTEPEAFGRSAVEAQAMGTPVVVSRLGAVTETVLAPPGVEPGARTGWHVASGDAAELAGAIRDATELGASAREALARRASAHVARRFSLDTMVRETLGIYTSLLAPRR